MKGVYVNQEAYPPACSEENSKTESNGDHSCCLVDVAGPSFAPGAVWSMSIPQSRLWSQWNHKKTVVYIPSQDIIKEYKNLRKWADQCAQNCKCVWPCFVCLIPSSKCYHLHVTGRETDSRGTKRLRGRNRTYQLADLGESARISFASRPLGTLDLSRVRRLGRSRQLWKGELPKWCFSPPSSPENTTIRILVPDALSHAWSPSLALTLPAIRNSCQPQGQHCPGAAKANSGKTLSTRHFSFLRWACCASSSLLILLFYGPNLLSVGLAWSS